MEKKLPYWFYIGVATNVVGWLISWAHILPFSSYTFILIWGGFILVVDGLNYRLRHTSLLSRSPKAFLFICLLSSLFWWYFELINIITRNWYYIIDVPITPLGYQFEATLFFTTVIPAVFEVTELVHFKQILGRTFKWFKTPTFIWILMLAAGISAMVLPFIQPDVFFPLIWLAPWLILDAINYKLKFDSLISDVVNGDWTRVVNLALATFFTGLLWEMWNLHADPKWVYAIPHVGFTKIFEMPLVGFAGYLPFGWAIFAFYSFFQGLFGYPRKQFFSESIQQFRPRLNPTFLIVIIAVVVTAFSVHLANLDVSANLEFNKQQLFPVQTKTPVYIGNEELFIGNVMTCHYAYIESKCLYTGVGETYLLKKTDGSLLRTNNQTRVQVVGKSSIPLVGLPEITVSKIIAQ